MLNLERHSSSKFTNRILLGFEKVIGRGVFWTLISLYIFIQLTTTGTSSVKNMASLPTIHTQDEEIADLKSSYNGVVKVISGIGEFANVVTIQPLNLDVHCKFQLTESYPSVVPTIIVRSTTLSADENKSLIAHLEAKADTLTGNFMLKELMHSCEKWIQEQSIDLTVKEISKKTKSKKSGKSNQNKSKSSDSEAEVDAFIKKPPMKTAADVIKRLQWDKAVNADDFIIGYLDRITGLEEKPFSAFTWEDLASVDPFVLAIPQHRIQFFKYKTEKVWDKNERLDNVFGSVGSELTIVEAMAKYNAKHEAEQNDDNEDIVAPGNIDDVATGGDTDERYTEDSVVAADGVLATCTASTDDFKISSTLDTCSPHATKESDDTPASENQEVTEKAQREKGRRDRHDRPNYFVAFQITNKDIVNNLKLIQTTFLESYPQYRRHMIADNGFHLTLSVMQLRDSVDINRCVETMEKIKPELLDLASKAGDLAFVGLCNFSKDVIFAKVQHSSAFLDLVNTIRRRLADAGVTVLEIEREFKPHLTLFKVPRSAVRDMPKVELTHTDDVFGSQAVDNIQVCQMGTLPKSSWTDDGFYKSISKLTI